MKNLGQLWQVLVRRVWLEYIGFFVSYHGLIVIVLPSVSPRGFDMVSFLWRFDFGCENTVLQFERLTSKILLFPVGLIKIPMYLQVDRCPRLDLSKQSALVKVFIVYGYHLFGSTTIFVEDFNSLEFWMEQAFLGGEYQVKVAAESAKAYFSDLVKLVAASGIQATFDNVVGQVGLVQDVVMANSRRQIRGGPFQ